MAVLLTIVQGDSHRLSGVMRDLTGHLCYRKWRRATRTSFSYPKTWSHPLKLQGGCSCQPDALADPNFCSQPPGQQGPTPQDPPKTFHFGTVLCQL